jgi:transposase
MATVEKITQKMKEERETLKNLFILAIKSRGINIPVETNKNGKV